MIETAFLKLICLDNNFAQKEFLRFLPDFQNCSGAILYHLWQTDIAGSLLQVATL